MIEVHPKMDYVECLDVYARHGLDYDSDLYEKATVLGGLEAELAAKDAEIAQLRQPSPFADGLFDGPDDPAFIDYMYQSSEEAALRREVARLTAELAATNAAAHDATNAYADRLWACEAECAKLRALVAKMEKHATTGEWSGINLAQEANATA